MGALGESDLVLGLKGLVQARLSRSLIQTSQNGLLAPTEVLVQCFSWSPSYLLLVFLAFLLLILALLFYYGFYYGYDSYSSCHAYPHAYFYYFFLS